MKTGNHSQASRVGSGLPNKTELPAATSAAESSSRAADGLRHQSNSNGCPKADESTATSDTATEGGLSTVTLGKSPLSPDLQP